MKQMKLLSIIFVTFTVAVFAQDQPAIIMPNETINNTTDNNQININNDKPIVLQNTTVINSNGDCLSTSNFCMNNAKCGLNGNCICARFFYGKQCELSIAST